MNVEYVFFDLDGTLTDSSKGITNSVDFALQKFGIKTEDKTSLYKFIGPPLIDSFIEFYRFSKNDAITAVEYYREYYGKTGIFENTLYDGVIPLLKMLKKKGKKIVLATSKPQKYALKILEHFGILEYFDLVVGATMGETRTKKQEVINFALKKLKIKDTNSVIMIGDRSHDTVGAHLCGIKAIGVLYGFGTEQELKSVYTEYIVSDMESLISFLK